MNLFRILLMLSIAVARANLPFFQGSGNEIVPGPNSNIRVISETLIFEPLLSAKCYALVTPKGKLPASFEGAIGPAKLCRRVKHEDAFHTHWKVTALYDLTAVEDQKNLTVGFPITTWTHDFLVKKSEPQSTGTFPGIIGFKAFIDGSEIKLIQKDQLVPSYKFEADGIQRTQQMATHGLTWNLSLNKGQHKLATEYELGVELVSEVPAEPKTATEFVPWYAKRSPPFLKASVLYHLTPLQLWAKPPPEAIKIRLHIPSTLSVTQFVLQNPLPTCIDLNDIFVQFKDSWPQSELTFTYPFSKEPVSKTKTFPLFPKSAEDFQKWRAQAGEAPYTCRLKDKINSEANRDLKDKLNSENCVKECAAN